MANTNIAIPRKSQHKMFMLRVYVLDMIAQPGTAEELLPMKSLKTSDVVVACSEGSEESVWSEDELFDCCYRMDG